MKITRRVAVTGSVALAGAGLMTAWVLKAEVPPQGLPGATMAGQPATTDDAVQRALRAGKPTVAEFGANACAQCREMKPVLETLRRAHGESIAVVNVDLVVQREANYIQRYRIQLMPTQIFFDAHGREIGRHLGKLSGEEILARLQVTGAPSALPPAAQRPPAGGSL